MTEFRPVSLEKQLEIKLELYQDVHRDFYQAKSRIQYLGGWLYRLSVDMARLRYDIQNQTNDEQLKIFNTDEYWEEQDVVLV